MIDKIEDAVPVKLCEYEKNGDLITVLFQEKKNSLIGKYLPFKLKNKPHKIDLDKIGSFIWEECDGHKSVAQIIENAKSKFLKEIEPADERVTLFMKQLHKTKLIQLYVKKD